MDGLRRHRALLRRLLPGDDVPARVPAAAGPSARGMGARIAAIRDTFALQQALYAHRDGDREQLADVLSGYL